jgi:hypothetical protein
VETKREGGVWLLVDMMGKLGGHYSISAGIRSRLTRGQLSNCNLSSAVAVLSDNRNDASLWHTFRLLPVVLAVVFSPSTSGSRRRDGSRAHNETMVAIDTSTGELQIGENRKTAAYQQQAVIGNLH